jgi:hypothetical protein
MAPLQAAKHQKNGEGLLIRKENSPYPFTFTSCRAPLSKTLVLESLLIFCCLNVSFLGFFFSTSSSWFADGKACTNSGYLDLEFLPGFRSWDENHKSLDFRYTFTASTGVGYFKVIYFANFNWLGWERSASAATVATAITIAIAA